MDYLVNNNPKPGPRPNTFIYNIRLEPGTQEERLLLEESGNDERIELYYHEAVDQKIGEDFSLLEVVDDRGWPFAAVVLVERTIGIG